MNLIVNSVQLAGQGGEMEQRNGGGRWFGGDEDEMERRGKRERRDAKNKKINETRRDKRERKMKKKKDDKSEKKRTKKLSK